jgi:hypothetical protein
MRPRKGERGVARITVTEASAEERDAKAAERAHLKVCWECKRAGKDIYARCDVGWNLAKRHHRAAHELAKLADPLSAGQPTLF